VAATIWWSAAVLMAMWVLGVVFNIGPIVHTLLALAVILAITNVVTNRTRI
jgi:hypothetical protein